MSFNRIIGEQESEMNEQLKALAERALNVACHNDLHNIVLGYLEVAEGLDKDRFVARVNRNSVSSWPPRPGEEYDIVVPQILNLCNGKVRAYQTNILDALENRASDEIIVSKRKVFVRGVTRKWELCPGA